MQKQLTKEEWKPIKGVDLIGMGFRKTREGFLISNTSEYEFRIVPGNWDIRRKQSDNTKQG